MKDSASKDGPLYQLCVFDDRRGTEEGNEDDKVLVAWPSGKISRALASVVGLAQAMISFMSNFEPEEPCSSINTANHLWALHQLEPHIWYLMLEDKQLLGASLREEAIKTVLQRLALLIRLLHGPMDAILAKDSTGAAARQLLQANVTEFMERFLQGREVAYAGLHHPLSGHQGLPKLPLPWAQFAGSTWAASNDGCACPNIPQLHAQQQVCIQQTVFSVSIPCRWWPLASNTLPAADVAPSPEVEVAQESAGSTPAELGMSGAGVQAGANPRIAANLQGESSKHQQARVGLTEATADGAVKGLMLMHGRYVLWSSLGIGDSQALHILATTAILPAVAANGAFSLGRRISSAYSARAASPRGSRPELSPKVWQVHSSGVLGLQSMNTGDLTAESLLHIYLQDEVDPHILLPYRSGEALLLLLLHDRQDVADALPELISQVKKEADATLKTLSTAANAELQATNHWHVPSLRYVFRDGLTGSVRGSPSSKIGTLAKETVLLLDSVQASLDNNWAYDMHQDGSKDLVIRGSQDAWVIARQAGSGRLLMAMENGADSNLLETSRRADALGYRLQLEKPSLTNWSAAAALYGLILSSVSCLQKLAAVQLQGSAGLLSYPSKRRVWFLPFAVRQNAGPPAGMQPAQIKNGGLSSQPLSTASSWDRLVAETLLEVAEAHSRPLNDLCLPSPSDGHTLLSAAERTNGPQRRRASASPSASSAEALDIVEAAVNQKGVPLMHNPSDSASQTALPASTPPEAAPERTSNLQLYEDPACSYPLPEHPVRNHSQMPYSVQQQEQPAVPAFERLQGHDLTPDPTQTLSQTPAPSLSRIQDTTTAAAEYSHPVKTVLDAALSHAGTSLDRQEGQQQQQLSGDSDSRSFAAHKAFEDVNWTDQLPEGLVSPIMRAAADAGSPDSRDPRQPPGGHAASAVKVMSQETAGAEGLQATSLPTGGAHGLREDSTPVNNLAMTGAQGADVLSLEDRLSADLQQAFDAAVACAQDHLEGHLAGEEPEEDTAVRDQIRSLHKASEEAAAEMARREAARRRPAGSIFFDDALHMAPRPQTFDPYANDAAAGDSELGSQPAADPSHWDSEDEDMSDMALEDAILAAHHNMAAEEADDDSAPELVNLSNDASPTAAESCDWNQRGVLRAPSAANSAGGLGPHQHSGLEPPAANEAAKASDMTFLTQLRSMGNTELPTLGSDDEDDEMHLRDTEQSCSPGAHVSAAHVEPQHSAPPAAARSADDGDCTYQGHSQQARAEEGPDEAVRMAAWQGYWQNEPGAYQPPPQGPPGFPLSPLHPEVNFLAGHLHTSAAENQHAPRGPFDSATRDMHDVTLSAADFNQSCEPRQLEQDRTVAESTTPVSLQAGSREGQTGSHSPAASAWQPWLQWWHGIAGADSAMGKDDAAAVDVQASTPYHINATDPETLAMERAADHVHATETATSAEVLRASFQPGHATRHVGDEDLIAVPVSLLRRYQQLEWEDWVRRWQVWHAQQVQPAADGCR
ncbi:hypothetical protein WJX74_004791 [Apatococcus lobatus]|uniref:CCZ1/INTU/HSP4 first Longin domain-containing protein n=1 Tax=Apatococcus lobatus TaxID=904363 RepID=A0AAW1RSL8_9CHLO